MLLAAYQLQFDDQIHLIKLQKVNPDENYIGFIQLVSQNYYRKCFIIEINYTFSGCVHSLFPLWTVSSSICLNRHCPSSFIWLFKLYSIVLVGVAYSRLLSNRRSRLPAHFYCYIRTEPAPGQQIDSPAHWNTPCIGGGECQKGDGQKHQFRNLTNKWNKRIFMRRKLLIQGISNKTVDALAGEVNL